MIQKLQSILKNRAIISERISARAESNPISSARAAAAGLLEDAEEAQAYFELCLVRLEAYHKWLEEYDAVEYEKAEKALQYYRSARDWAKKFVRAFDNGF